MYYNILTFFIAVIIQGFGSQTPEATWTIGNALMLAAFPILAWAGLRFYFQRLMHGALHDEKRARTLQSSLLNVVATCQNWLLLPFAALHFATPYQTLIVKALGGQSELATGLLGIGPFIVFLIILWWEAYSLHCLLIGRTNSRLGFIISYARMELSILAPWVIALGLGEIFKIGDYLEAHPRLIVLYLAIFFTLLAIFMPLMARMMWNCKSLPDGPLRSRIEKNCKDLGVNVRDILDWPLLGGSLLNAGIMGVLPQLRYVLITPALVEVLTPEELDGVIAHEAGHAKYQHFLFYLIVFLGFSYLTVIFLVLTTYLSSILEVFLPDYFHFLFNDNALSAIMALGLIAILFFYFRVMFGAVSRAFERQADGFVIEATRRPDIIISALERIGLTSDDVRESPSWHHGSIAERVSFLNNADENPRLLKVHKSLVHRIKLALIVGLALAAATATGILPSTEQNGHKFRTRVDQHEITNLLDLASQYQTKKMLAEAVRTYNEILLMKPDNYMALNNLAWLYATSEDPKFYKPERALALAEIAVKLSPEPYILDTYAEALYRTHNVEGALAAINIAIAKKPADPKHYLLQKKKFMNAFAQEKKADH